MTDVPVMQVVPIEDLDKIEKLLDVALNCVELPNLNAIKQACLDELAQINNSMAQAQGAALETYNKEMADWQAAEVNKAKKAEEPQVSPNVSKSVAERYPIPPLQERRI